MRERDWYRTGHGKYLAVLRFEICRRTGAVLLTVSFLTSPSTQALESVKTQWGGKYVLLTANCVCEKLSVMCITLNTLSYF